ncbi:SIS domain-containing protein [Lacrimispora saccharolytica]|uniref:Phosphoheptose isomerase n=1 Tax=Lacrimispora saccharolytica (strain ATCC 35040 / DSM 2544 / NRCC 2533 / WM1) TaxID=610130 RepID=D9RA29_LACSW|nr:SIS domain-containing protein [Lacrimispora saccharolytica]ADL06001.1 putative phosphoheptose isomerase [[Clostridium] saccharolyticum WM1]
MYKEYLEKFYEVLQNTEYTVMKNEKMETVEYETAFSQLLDLFQNAKKNRKQIFFIGNGGSCAIAEHATADFLKNGRMCTVNLLHAPLLTCMGNDFGYDHTFSNPIELLGNKNDLLVTISSSGNSPNIIHAIHIAKEKEMKVLTLSGFAMDNQSRQLGDINIYAPIHHYGIVESIHNLLLQQIVDFIMERENRE